MQKKNLLITTALATLISTSAFADGASPSIFNDMNVKIGGLFQPQFITGKTKYGGGRYLTPNNKKMGLDTNAEFFIEAQNRTEKGLEYGAHIGIQTNTLSSNQPNKWISNSWLWADCSDMGRIEFGSNNGASESMRQGADRVAVATGGISGHWFKILNNSAFGGGISMHEFYYTPWSVGEYGLDLYLYSTVQEETLYERARKISYYTPKMNGFQVGVTYTPDAEVHFNSGRRGARVSAMPNTRTTVGADAAGYDLLSAGISWEGKIRDDIDASISLVGMHSKARKGANPQGAETHDINAFDIGGMLSHNKLKAAASFGYTGKTGFQKGTTGLSIKGAWYATLGGSYEIDKFVTSLTYIHGNKNKNTSNVISLGADYNLAPGIVPYAEVTHYNLHLKREGGLALQEGFSAESDSAAIIATDQTNRKDNGTAFIVGTKLSF